MNNIGGEVKKIFFSVFNFINLIVPKNKHKVVFCGQPDYDDMLKGMLPYIEGDLVILVNDTNIKKPDWLDLDCKIYSKKSIHGVFNIIRARRIYYTHGIFGFFKPINKKKQYVINLWHGMPLKRIGRLFDNDNVCLFHSAISTSDLYSSILSDLFDVDEANILTAGLPRNNILLEKSHNLLLNDFEREYESIYVWLPTFQEVDQEYNFWGGSFFDYNKLNEWLCENNTYLIIKPHPLDVVNISTDMYSNIEVIDEPWLAHHNMTLYELLSISDSLWTDYSSVFVDYIVLNKPIIFIQPNLDKYKSVRGLISVLEQLELPGVKVTNERELYYALDKLGDMKVLDELKEIYNSVHKYNNKLVEDFLLK